VKCHCEITGRRVLGVAWYRRGLSLALLWPLKGLPVIAATAFESYSSFDAGVTFLIF